MLPLREGLAGVHPRVLERLLVSFVDLLELALAHRADDDPLRRRGLLNEVLKIDLHAVRVADDLVAGLLVDLTEGRVLLRHESQQAQAGLLLVRDPLQRLEQRELGLRIESANVEPDAPPNSPKSA